jgi:hypothetical protein
VNNFLKSTVDLNEAFETTNLLNQVVVFSVQITATLNLPELSSTTASVLGRLLSGLPVLLASSFARN